MVHRASVSSPFLEHLSLQSSFSFWFVHWSWFPKIILLHKPRSPWTPELNAILVKWSYTFKADTGKVKMPCFSILNIYRVMWGSCFIQILGTYHQEFWREKAGLAWVLGIHILLWAWGYWWAPLRVLFSKSLKWSPVCGPRSFMEKRTSLPWLLWQTHGNSSLCDPKERLQKPLMENESLRLLARHSGYHHCNLDLELGLRLEVKWPKQHLLLVFLNHS